jgi:hypothetical protein
MSLTNINVDPHRWSALAVRKLTGEELLSLKTAEGLMAIAEQKALKQVVVDFLLSKR